ncbi:MAG: ExbD/TolR family protein [Thalassovita sp.]
MDFQEPTRRPRGENIVPMINVVFLLLIFFLMTSEIAPPEPFDVTPPAADSATDPSAEPILYVDAKGQLAFENLRDASAIAALAERSAKDQVIQLRADAELEAKTLARILRQLAESGLSRVELMVASK